MEALHLSGNLAGSERHVDCAVGHLSHEMIIRPAKEAEESSTCPVLCERPQAGRRVGAMATEPKILLPEASNLCLPHCGPGA